MRPAPTSNQSPYACLRLGPGSPLAAVASVLFAIAVVGVAVHADAQRREAEGAFVGAVHNWREPPVAAVVPVAVPDHAAALGFVSAASAAAACGALDLVPVSPRSAYPGRAQSCPCTTSRPESCPCGWVSALPAQPLTLWRGGVLCVSRLPPGTEAAAGLPSPPCAAAERPCGAPARCYPASRPCPATRVWSQNAATAPANATCTPWPGGGGDALCFEARDARPVVDLGTWREPAPCEGGGGGAFCAPDRRYAEADSLAEGALYLENSVFGDAAPGVRHALRYRAEVALAEGAADCGVGRATVLAWDDQVAALGRMQTAVLWLAVVADGVLGAGFAVATLAYVLKRRPAPRHLRRRWHAARAGKAALAALAILPQAALLAAIAVCSRALADETGDFVTSPCTDERTAGVVQRFRDELLAQEWASFVLLALAALEAAHELHAVYAWHAAAPLRQRSSVGRGATELAKRDDKQRHADRGGNGAEKRGGETELVLGSRSVSSDSAAEFGVESGGGPAAPAPRRAGARRGTPDTIMSAPKMSPIGAAEAKQGGE